MNKVFYCNVPKNIDFSLIEKGFCSLRKDYISKIKDVERRKQSIAVWALLIKAIREFFPNLNPLFEVDEKGKWFDSKGNIYFSLSHCKNIVAVSISTSNTAIDVECVSDKVSFLKKCSYIQSDIKLEVLDEIELTRLWTQKECSIKAGMPSVKCDTFNLILDKNHFVFSVFFEKGEFNIDKDFIKLEL